MAIGIGLDDTPICWDSYFTHLEEMKEFERKRQVTLLEAKDKAHAAIKEFLNGQDT
jgi:hypothetical protein